MFGSLSKFMCSLFVILFVERFLCRRVFLRRDYRHHRNDFAHLRHATGYVCSRGWLGEVLWLKEFHQQLSNVSSVQ